MKKLYITLAIALCSTCAIAQTKEDTVTVRMPRHVFETTKQVLEFSYLWLPKSSAPSNDVQNVLPAIQEIYKALVPDTAKKVHPKTKK